MQEEKWIIRWNDMSQAYLYGSNISFTEEKTVVFKNPLMPPSAVINSWFSRTNYYTQKLEPALPILQNNRNYQLSQEAQTKGRGGLFMRLVFLDRFGEVLEERIIREESGVFTYPEDAYSYRIDLINGGITELVFDHMTLREADDEEE